MADSRHERNFLKTLERGLRVLSAFSPVKPELSLREIAEILGDDSSTAYRFVYTLEELGYLDRDETSKLYHVTPKVYTLAISLVGPRNLKTVALPHLERLRNRTGETAVLSVRDGADVVIIEVVETRHTLAPRGWVGGRVPGYCSAMGKAMLAYLPEDQLLPLLDVMPMVPRTPKTITNRLQFLDDLRQTRARGWALNQEEYSLGVVSIAAPLLSDGRPIAAMCIDVPTARVNSREQIEMYGAEVIAASEGITSSARYELMGQG